ncbi:hypothetical protein THAOC_02060, partial [Thalassiosira oceanica]
MRDATDRRGGGPGPARTTPHPPRGCRPRAPAAAAVCRVERELRRSEFVDWESLVELGESFPGSYFSSESDDLVDLARTTRSRGPRGPRFADEEHSLTEANAEFSTKTRSAGLPGPIGGPFRDPRAEGSRLGHFPGRSGTSIFMDENNDGAGFQDKQRRFHDEAGLFEPVPTKKASQGLTEFVGVLELESVRLGGRVGGRVLCRRDWTEHGAMSSAPSINLDPRSAHADTPDEKSTVDGAGLPLAGAGGAAQRHRLGPAARSRPTASPPRRGSAPSRGGTPARAGSGPTATPAGP